MTQQKQTLSLGFSPCPNDTFIFDALVNGKIKSDTLAFKPVIADVEELNQLALKGALDITKLSYHALGHLLPIYQLLHAGSALGNNCGPLLIAKKRLSKPEIENATIAIPGKYTTANFLLGLAYPNLPNKNKQELLFSDIEQAVLEGRVDAGLIIHENRFTYQDKGLIKLIDLGEHWETLTQLPIPLGGITIKRNLPTNIKQEVNRLLQQSVQMAFDNPQGTSNYVRQYAQEMDEAVMFKHINLYVNSYSLDLGEMGRKAVRELFSLAQKKGLIERFEGDILVAGTLR